METTYDLIIEWTGEKYLIHYGKPSEHGFTATLADEFTLGASKCVVWLVNCELTPEAVQRIVSAALRKL